MSRSISFFVRRYFLHQFVQFPSGSIERVDQDGVPTQIGYVGPRVRGTGRNVDAVRAVALRMGEEVLGQTRSS